MVIFAGNIETFAGRKYAEYSVANLSLISSFVKSIVAA